MDGSPALTASSRLVLDHLHAHGIATRDGIRATTGLSGRTLRHALRQLKTQQLIDARPGLRTRDIHYFLRAEQTLTGFVGYVVP